MNTALSVPCPWGCGSLVDLADSVVWESCSQEMHVCEEGIVWRAEQAVRDLDTCDCFGEDDMDRENAMVVLEHIASELGFYFHNHPEVVRVRALLRSAAKGLRR